MVLLCDFPHYPLPHYPLPHYPLILFRYWSYWRSLPLLSEENPLNPDLNAFSRSNFLDYSATGRDQKQIK